MRRTFAVPLLAAALLAPPAQALQWQSVDPNKSSLTFVFRQMNVPVDGQFKKFTGQLFFDPRQPDAARASIDLDVGSIDAGSDEANDAVVGKAWFNAKEFPVAKFVSTTVKPLGGNRYQVNGKISIKGRTQDVSAPVTATSQGGTTVFDGSFVLKRSDFAIGEGIWADFDSVANEIQIKFHFLASASK